MRLLSIPVVLSCANLLKPMLLQSNTKPEVVSRVETKTTKRLERSFASIRAVKYSRGAYVIIGNCQRETKVFQRRLGHSTTPMARINKASVGSLEE